MIKENFFAGLRTILPFLLFVIILGWVLGILFYWIDCIQLLIPGNVIDELNLPDIVIKTIGLIMICVGILCIGIVSRQPRMSEKFRIWLEPIICRIPLLGNLFKITNQVTSTLRDTDSFKKVVLVRFPTERSWSVGFVTGENPKVICEAMNRSDLVSVFVPTTPNPTSGFLMFMGPDDFVETNVPVSSAITLIISMGAAGATDEILKESHSYVEWDFF